MRGCSERVNADRLGSQNVQNIKPVKGNGSNKSMKKNVVLGSWSHREAVSGSVCLPLAVLPGSTVLYLIFIFGDRTCMSINGSSSCHPSGKRRKSLCAYSRRTASAGLRHESDPCRRRAFSLRFEFQVRVLLGCLVFNQTLSNRVAC